MRNLTVLLAVFAAVFSLSFSPIAENGTTVYIVRHAEKGMSGKLHYTSEINISPL